MGAMTMIGRTVIAIAVVSCAIAHLDRTASAQPAATPSAATYGMSQYVDPAYGFSLWYPGALKITAAAASDADSFPGGVVVETLQVGDPERSCGPACTDPIFLRCRGAAVDGRLSGRPR